jgi:hypothetical protein
MGKISTAEVLRLRATSAVSRDRSVGRFAQDDGFVWGLETQLVGCRKREKIEKVTGSQDDDFVGIWTENILNKLALMGRSPGLSSAVRVRQAQGRLCGTHFAIIRF